MNVLTKTELLEKIKRATKAQRQAVEAAQAASAAISGSDAGGESSPLVTLSPGVSTQR
jgi:hypothetical protein